MEMSVFKIKKMDCPSEEAMIRMRLESIPEIQDLNFDIPKRELKVLHAGNLDCIRSSIDSLNLSSSLMSTEIVSGSPFIGNRANIDQSRLLWTVLSINLVFFLIEIVSGLSSKSMGLIADSLDMLADALVYGLSLFAVGATVARKKRIASVSGYFQLILALIGLAEVVRRMLGYEHVPDFKTMIVISLLALGGNAACLYLLQKSKSDEAHMQASMIFTSNDVIINLGVIISGVLVFWLDSKFPDLIVGSIVFVLVTRGAFAILKLSR
jgi:Co/Zn/Cd efflux system component